LLGAGVGAGAGAAIGAASPLIRRGFRNVADFFRRSDVNQIAAELGISTNAAKVIRNTFDQGGDIDQAVANIRRAGDEAMLADAGQAAQALLDASASSGGAASQAARQAISERGSRVLGATREQIRETLGEAPLGPTRAVEAIRARTRDARGNAYNAAYASEIDYTTPQGQEIVNQLQRIDPNVLNEAISTANTRMRGDQIAGQRIISRVGDDGEIQFGRYIRNDQDKREFIEQLPNVIQLDYIKRALDLKAEQGRTPLGLASDDTRFYGSLASGLRNAVRDAVPAYGEALRLGGETIQDQNAFRLGSQLLREGTEIEDVIDELGDEPSATQLEAMRLGLARQIDKILGDVRALPSNPDIEQRQLDRLISVTSSPNAMNKIREVLGEEAEPLIARLEQASQTALVRAGMSLNSKTNIRGNIDRLVEDVAAPGPLRTLQRGEPINTTKELIQIVTGETAEYTAEQRQRIYQDIARALTQRGDRTAEEVLRLITSAMEGQPMTEAQNEFAARYLTAALGLGGGFSTARAANREE
jgi:hypothetical protein